MAKVYVVGVGMTKFEKPGKRDWDYPQMCTVAIRNALEDANVSYDKVEMAYVGYVYGDSTCGQRAIYETGLTGIPVINVNNNCSTGSTALFLGRNAIMGGQAECVLALGFEKMERGSLKSHWEDRSNPMEKHMMHMVQDAGFDPKAPGTAQLFGNAGREHMKLYGTQKSTFSKIAQKNHAHSMLNPYAQFRKEFTLEEIEKAPQVFDPLTKLGCCPTSDGAGAALLCSEKFVLENNLQGQAIEIVGQAMATDTKSTFEKSHIDLVGGDMTRRAAHKAYKQAGITAKDVQVIELHDCFAANELISYEALGLAPTGKAEELVLSGRTKLGGAGPIINVSGGLISKGHPLGATGLAQCAELCWQLRGMCGPRQVINSRYALQHNVGLGGACVVTIYKHGFPAFKPSAYVPEKRNPALELDPEEPTHDKDSVTIAPPSAKL